MITNRGLGTRTTLLYSGHRHWRATLGRILRLQLNCGNGESLLISNACCESCREEGVTFLTFVFPLPSRSSGLPSSIAPKYKRRYLKMTLRPLF